jgi:ABC-type transport system substrate-binding protein
VNRRDRLSIGALLLALAVVGVALVMPPSSPAPKTSVRPTGGAVPYREGIVGHPSSINPLTPRSQADQDLVALLFRGLTKAGPDGSVLPDLASWAASADGRTYDFLIGKDAQWEDGQPVTAADVVFTIGLVQDSKYDGPVGYSWQGVTATAVSDYVVRFTMTLPIAGFLRQTELPILPEHLLRDTPIASLADSDFSSHPVGDGPYKIDEIDFSHALLTRVPAVTGSAPPTLAASKSPSQSPSPVVFATATPKPTPTSKSSRSPGPTPVPTPTATPLPTPTPTPTPTPQLGPLASGAVLAGIDDLELTFYDDAASAAADFRAGKLDVVGGLTSELTDTALTTAGSRLVPYRWASLLSVVVNQRSDHPELADPNVRTGLLAAIDRSALLAKVLDGRGSSADLPIPNWSPAYDPTAVTPTVYSGSDAEENLTTAGWKRTAAGWTAPKGTTTYTMDLLTPDEASNPVLYQTAVRVADAWRAIGLEVTVSAVTTSAYLTRLYAGQFGSAIVDFEVGLDPDLGPMLLSTQVGSGGSNVSGMHDPTLDQLLLKVRKTVDPADRKLAVSDLERYLSTTMPILPLAFRDYDLVVSNGVRGLVSNEISDPSGRFWDVIDWRLASAR